MPVTSSPSSASQTELRPSPSAMVLRYGLLAAVVSGGKKRFGSVPKRYSGYPDFPGDARCALHQATNGLRNISGAKAIMVGEPERMADNVSRVFWINPGSLLL